MNTIAWIITILIVAVLILFYVISCLNKRLKETKVQLHNMTENYCSAYDAYCKIRDQREKEHEIDEKAKETVADIKSGTSSDAADKLRKPTAGRKRNSTKSAKS